MSLFQIEDGILVKYTGAGSAVTVPHGVRGIGANAFESCPITEITLPEGVMSIFDSAFLYCTALERVTLPTTLRHIGNFAFAECHALAEISLPSGLSELGYNAFACTGLTAFSIPDSLTALPEGVLWRCRALGRLHIPSHVNTIEAGALEECDALTAVTFAVPDGWHSTAAPKGTQRAPIVFDDPTENARLLRETQCGRYFYHS